MLEIMLDNRNGTAWNLTEVVPELTIQTTRIGKAGTLQFTVLLDSLFGDPEFMLSCGDAVRIRMDGESYFRGYVFSIEEPEERILRITAYDQLRYLLEADDYIRANVTATQIIRDQCLSAGLTVGELTDTKYAIPTFMQDGQKRLDMIYKALDDTLLETGRTYIFFDDAGQLRLRDVNDMAIDLILGDNHLVYRYSYKREIDTDTYNRVRLVQENKDTGGKITELQEDPSTIAQWGRLQYFRQVDEGLNRAQIKAMAERFLELKNREQRKFTLESIGDPGVRAGVKLQVTINKLKINQFYLVEECTHRFDGQDHTMSLELRVYG